MKINFPMIQRDITDRITINAPPMIKGICANVMETVIRTEAPEYQKVSQYDNWLVLEYWKQIDGFPQTEITKTTSADLIVRARQYLVEKNYLIPKANAEKWAQTAAKGWKR